MKVLTWALVSVMAGACAGAPTPAPSLAADRSPEAAVLLHIVFDPPLAEPGDLTVEHECGVQLRVTTGRSGVDLRLPPGPASLRLAVGDEVWLRPAVVGAGHVVWSIVPDGGS